MASQRARSAPLPHPERRKERKDWKQQASFALLRNAVCTMKEPRFSFSFFRSRMSSKSLKSCTIILVNSFSSSSSRGGPRRRRFIVSSSRDVDTQRSGKVPISRIGDGSLCAAAAADKRGFVNTSPTRARGAQKD